jgi:hypothetical protein
LPGGARGGAVAASVPNSVYRLIRAHTAHAPGGGGSRRRLPAVDLVLRWRQRNHRADLRAGARAADPCSALAALGHRRPDPVRASLPAGRTGCAASTGAAAACRAASGRTPGSAGRLTAIRRERGAEQDGREIPEAVIREDRRLRRQEGWV